MTRPLPNLENIPSNKFYPPHIDVSRSLLRTGLLTTRLNDALASNKLIVIEAQAGQGKSVLVAQFLTYHRLNHIWYQIGSEDADPFCVLSSLLFNLNEKYPELAGTELESILYNGKLGSLDLQRCANLLLHEFATRLPHNLYIVFDDTHLLTDNHLTNTLIDYLIDTSPPKLRFVLTSRFPLHLKCRVLRNNNSICRLRTGDLAFTGKEIEEYLTSVLKRKPDKKRVEDILRVTGGWIMGVVLAGHASDGWDKLPSETAVSGSMSPVEQQYLFDFFRDEIFAQIPKDLHDALLKLSCLSDIPLQLARIISRREDIDSILADLVVRNLFIYYQEGHLQTFRLHGLFQEFLQQQATIRIAPDELRRVRISEAEYYLYQGIVDKAILCYIHAGDFPAIESVLIERGTDLLQRNTMFSILSALESIPEATIHRHSWIALYVGLLRFDLIPHTTLPFFESAQTTFSRTGEEKGEIMSLAMTTYYHIIVSGNYRAGAAFLPRLNELLLKKTTTLPRPVRNLAARSLAFGFFLFAGDTKKARSCLALQGSQEGRRQQSAIAGGRFIRGYIEMFSGSHAVCMKEAEACYALLSHPLVAMSDKLFIRTLLLCRLSMIGDQLNFSAELKAIERMFTPKVLERTFAALHFHAWESSNLFALGRTAEAMDILHRGMAIAVQKTTPYMQSQILQWKAFGHALLGQRDEALAAIKLSIHLHNESGGSLHHTFNAIMAGTVYSRLGMADEAESCFEQGLEGAKCIPSHYFLICVYLNRSHHKLVTRGPEPALDDLRTGLVLMRMHQVEHFWTWEPAMMTLLLSLAVENDIEKDFVTALAQKTLDISVNDSGDLMPQLHFFLLDHFHISLGGRTIFQASNFSPSQRELLSILLTTKGQQINQEQVQLAIWPDSPPINARRSFDTLLTRLRNRIDPALPHSAKLYLVLKKGILELAHSQTDALQFIAAARAGLRHARARERWQAGNAFRTAFSLLNGLWPEDTFCSEKAVALNDQIISTLIEATISWAAIMVRAGETEEAMSLVERSVNIYFYDERLVSLLYALYRDSSNHLKAGNTLERYKSVLKRNKYTDEEIDDLQDEIISFSLKKLVDLTA
ncbi:hypothetical protein JWG42_11685 [Desulfoprunum benzoelyticum]|uniref:DNA-binding SARP family transcriptional activator n=1 Tax=Desulfoprunum benzoelyticum TaxID=1506996 RepID=A0A840URU0_9BACT|nr:BTAD domain-containing putative transcriptional regulator [Desulfoprunum benzoelyticum]MBB5348937.1 DNA-binding SARP family transcriptional activator [Desulfoprunum benzoelyticum]MBM9530811.1 hypothetical protein [Desulfoprunum benzoelyticum]